MHGQQNIKTIHSGFKNHSVDVAQGNNCPVCVGKGKGKVHPITGHEGPDGEGVKV